MYKSFFLSAVFLFLATITSNGQNQPTGLLIDLISNTERPHTEIHSKNPLFSWIVPGKKQGTVQMSYQIIIADSQEKAEQGLGNVYNADIKSEQSIAVAANNLILKPSTAYYWRVRTVTNTEGKSKWSVVKQFNTARDLKDNAISSEALVKTRQQPLLIRNLQGNVKFIDFGKDAFAQLTVNLTSSSENDTVILSYGEALKEGRLNTKPGGTIRYQKISLPLKKGKHTYNITFKKDQRNTGSAAVLMPEYIGEVFPFRYVEIAGYKSNLNKKDLYRDMVHYPFDDQASYFKSSNDTLNRIWELCKYSIKATSFAGIYVDGDRERIPYEADALINQLGHYGVDREYSMARRSIDYLLERPTWPTEWILQALIISWNDYMYTGDKRLLEERYQILKNRTLTQLKGKNNLISTSTGLQNNQFAKSIKFEGKIRDIVDWPVSETDGFVFNDYNAVVNAFYYKALLNMEKIAELLNKKEDQLSYQKESATLKAAYQNIFFDNKTGLYKDGEATNHSSLHTNMFAMNFGLVPETNQKAVMEFIKSRGMASSVYGSQFLMESLYDGLDGDYALKLLTDTGIRSWYNMIRVGSTITLEAWDNKFKPNQDWNHAWGAAPANLIPRKLMGIEPISAGFEEISIMPQTGTLKQAEIVMPSICGPIKVAIKNAEIYTLTVTLPANMRGQVYLPVLNGKSVITCNGKLIQTERVAGKPFLKAGKIQSGVYTFKMTEKE